MADLKRFLDTIAGLNRIAHTAATPKVRRALFIAKAELINELAASDTPLEVRVVRPGLLFIRVTDGRGWHLPVAMSSETLLGRLHS